ncbi:MAG: hypothetical protein KZQ71_14315 [Candidatus Thiodiazotropha sp. (ex Lucinoma aequizonata)]|nr:hypothetical protein [Candidatus Thiodiazotropha sp. (ex Lucinoma aequizonata)]
MFMLYCRRLSGTGIIYAISGFLIGSENLNNTMKIKIISAISLYAALAISVPLHAGHIKGYSIRVTNWSTKTALMLLQSEKCDRRVCGWGKLHARATGKRRYSLVHHFDGVIDGVWLTISTPGDPMRARVFSVDLSPTGMISCNLYIDKQGKKTLECAPGDS